uniref:Beta-defensin n=1 Tax=Bos mutus grunniens TaxID=30521 RepID=A0A8B9WVI5_BOSMU
MRKLSRAELKDFAFFCFERVWCQSSRMKMAHEIGFALPEIWDSIFWQNRIKASLNLGSDLDAGRICGYGTARCRRNCKRQELRVGKCPNTYPCCLKKWKVNSLNPQKDTKPRGAWLLEMATSQTSEPPFSGPSRWTVPSGSSRLVE